MRAIFLSIFLLAPSHLFALCPDVSLREVAADCPWAEFAREVQSFDAKSIEIALARELADLARQMKIDAGNDAYKALWGRSINYDEIVKDEIVSPRILNALGTIMKSPTSTDRIQHAGLEHTYGYLFSTLATSFGYKRARWVSGEIEEQVGLPAGLLGPSCTSGTMFANITAFMGKIAFSSDVSQQRILDDNAWNVAAEIKEFDFNKLSVERLLETVEIADGISVSLRTDIVNKRLLIYSVFDSRESGAKLITAFPVAASFADAVFLPKGLGEKKKVTTRYNGYVEGMTGRSFVGSRRKVVMTH